VLIAGEENVFWLILCKKTFGAGSAFQYLHNTFVRC